MAAPIVITGAGGAVTSKSDIYAAAEMIVAVVGVPGPTNPLDAELWLTAPDGTITSPGAAKIGHLRAALNSVANVSFSSDGITIAREGQVSGALFSGGQGQQTFAVKFNDADVAHEVWIYAK